MEVLVLWKYPPGNSFSNGVVPAVTPLSSTVAPEGLLVICSFSAEARQGQTSSSRIAERQIREREAMQDLARRIDPIITYHVIMLLKQENEEVGLGLLL